MVDDAPKSTGSIQLSLWYLSAYNVNFSWPQTTHSHQRSTIYLIESIHIQDVCYVQITVIGKSIGCFIFLISEWKLLCLYSWYVWKRKKRMLKFETCWETLNVAHIIFSWIFSMLFSNFKAQRPRSIPISLMVALTEFFHVDADTNVHPLHGS